MRAAGKAKTAIWRWQERFRDEGAAGFGATRAPVAHPPLKLCSGRTGCRNDLGGAAATASHWTGAAMAKAAGISVGSVQRSGCTWTATASDTPLQLSDDPRFAAKLRRSSCTSIRPTTPSCSRSMRKARSRRWISPEPAMPMKKGRAGTMTHDYKRHGVSTLFAALDVLEGKVVGQCGGPGRHQVIRFLTVIDARLPEEENGPCHCGRLCCSPPPGVGMDRQTSAVPISSSPQRQPPRSMPPKVFFRQTHQKCFKCGVFDLSKNEQRHPPLPDDTNANPKPFSWTKDRNKIIASRQTRAPTVRFDPLEASRVSEMIAKSNAATCATA